MGTVTVIEKTGEFAPARLQRELADAGVHCHITCTEDDAGTVTAVQVIGDDLDATVVKGVCAAHVPGVLPADALAAIRAQRDLLLAGCDWTQMADSPLDDAARAAWAAYRQQLREYPDQDGFDPLNPPVWPTPPA